MVYCGKASQGCQSCRTRRIKCDKARPDCSQCVRVGKKCPGYRDQLSLMFRDESNKVIQKAHAQWGVGEGFEGLVNPRSPGRSSSQTPRSAFTDENFSPVTLPSPPSSQPDVVLSASRNNSTFRLRPSISSTLEEQGFDFYVNRYLVGHPDEPRNAQELKSSDWLWNPALRGLMAAVGLASLSNLRDNADLMTDAQRRYGHALRITGQMIRADHAPSVEVTSRLVVMLALFELVKGVQLSSGSVHAHVAGGAALIRNWYPMTNHPCQGIRPLLQLCYSTFISSYEAGIPLPPLFYDWVAFARKVMVLDDGPAIDLGMLIAQFAELSSHLRGHILTDGQLSTVKSFQRLIDLEARLATWEATLQGHWCYRTEPGSHLPPAAVFDGEYHVYYDVWVARIWNHYRWARTLVNEIILELAKKYPVVGNTFVPTVEVGNRTTTIKKLCRETLISTPSHWRHPLLNEKTHLPVEQDGGAGAGSGSAAIPILLFHLKVAACAPGIPQSWWSWTHSLIECIWGDMGMSNAKSMMEALISHRGKLEATDSASSSSLPSPSSSHHSFSTASPTEITSIRAAD